MIDCRWNDRQIADLVNDLTSISKQFGQTEQVRDRISHRFAQFVQINKPNDNQKSGVVYAFEWCDCVYESGFSIESLHQTKAGAYRAMRKALVERWIESRGGRGVVAPLDEPLYSSAWRVREIEIQQ